MNGYGRKNRKRMKRIAAVLSAALILCEFPSEQLFAAQQAGGETVTYIQPEETAYDEADGQTSADGEESESTESTSGSAFGGETENEEEMPEGNWEEKTEDETEAGGKAENDGTEANGKMEGTGTETDGETEEAGTEADGETGEAGTKADGETEEAGTEADGEIEEDRKDSEENVEEQDESRIRYGLGREMTEEEIAAQKALEPSYLPEIEVLELPEETKLDNFSLNQVYSARNYEEKYDSREKGILTETKNQNPWGTCWAFSVLAAMESSLIQQNMETQDSIDLSESHLAYFVGHTGYDVLGNASGDTIATSPESYYLERGGNIFYAAMKLMNWQGAAEESEFPYRDLPNVLPVTDAQKSAVHLKTSYFVSAKANDSTSIGTIKGLLKEYGSVVWSYYHDSNCYNYSTYGYFSRQYSKTNHAILVVGWDDTYARENFGTSEDADSRPSEDGAWIVRNSWSSGWGENGYFYISYEDRSLGSGNAAGVVIADNDDDYDNNYFYGNTASGTYWGNAVKCAQVFQVKGNQAEKEKLTAVSLLMASAGTDYKIQVYKNPELTDGVVTNPESGEPMLETALEGTTSYPGLYTITLPKPVLFRKGDYMAIVISFPNMDEKIYADVTSGAGTAWEQVNETAPGESFVGGSFTAGGWVDLYTEGYSLKINALTNDVDGNITAPDLKISAMQPKSFQDSFTAWLSWEKCPDAVGYEIYRGTSPEEEFVKIAEVPYSERRYQDKIGREYLGGTYYYYVSAVYDDGLFAESQIKETKTDKTVVFPVFRLASGAGSASVSWDAVEGAAGYEIWRKGQAEPEWQLLVKLTGEECLSYTDDFDGIQTNCYQYRARAYSSGEEYTDWSEVRTAVQGLLVTQADYRTAQMQWAPAEGAAKYYIYTKVGTTGYGKAFYTTSAKIDLEEWYESLAVKYPSKNIPAFRTGDVYSFYVRALNADGEEVYRSDTVTFRPVPDPLLFERAQVMEGSRIELSWSGGEGADRVQIYRSESPREQGEFYDEAQAAASTYTDSDILRGRTYYYRLCPVAENSAGETVEGAVTPYKAVELYLTKDSRLESARAVSDTECLIEWEENEQADGYFLYRSRRKGMQGQQIADIGNRKILQYSDMGLEAGNVNYYRIAPYVVMGDGETKIGKLSEQAGVRMLPAAVQMKKNREIQKGSTKISWEQADGAEGYIVERRKQGEDFDRIAVIPGAAITEYKDAAVSAGILYEYRVAAYNYNVDTDHTMQCGQVSEAAEVTVMEESDGSAELILNHSSIVLSKGNHVGLFATIVPSNVHYTDLVWMAEDALGNVYPVETMQGTFIVRGSDGKEILRITDGNLYASGESADKEVWLLAVKERLETKCKVVVNVPVTGIAMQIKEVNDMSADTASELKVGDRVWMDAVCAPQNADDTTIHWTTDNERVAAVEERGDSGVIITAKGTGECTITASAKNGVSVRKKISVGKAKEVYGIWLSDKELTGCRVTKNGAGKLVTEALEDKPVYEVCADGVDRVFVLPYVLTEENAVKDEAGAITGGMLCRAADSDVKVVFKSADLSVAEADESGGIWANKAGETDIFAYDANGNAVFGRCHIVATQPKGKRITLNHEIYYLKPGRSVTLKATVFPEDSEDRKVTWKSGDESIAVVSENGKVTVKQGVKGSGKITVPIECCLASDREIAASCCIVVDNEAACPVDRAYKLSAVNPVLQIQSYGTDSKSSGVLAVKNQYGEQLNPELFTFTSEEPSVCMADERGTVFPNPELVPKKNTKCKITAALKDDPAARKVTFQVTVLSSRQVERIEVERVSYSGKERQTEEINGVVGQKFEKGATLTFAARAFDSSGKEIETPSLSWSVTDKTLASVKPEGDSVTVTLKKAGRVNLVCKSKDEWKRQIVVQIAALSAAPVISTKQVTLNRKKQMTEEGQRVSESFYVTAPNGAEVGVPKITAVKKGSGYLGERNGLENFKIISNGDGSYSIAVDNRTDGNGAGFADSMKRNAVYEVIMQTVIYKIPEITQTAEATESFSVKVKVVDKVPSVSVSAMPINRFFIQEEDLTGLLVIKAPGSVANAEILQGGEQINNFDKYFTIKKKNGHWYLQFSDSTGSYNKTAIKGKIAFTVEGCEPVIKTVSVKTPVKRPLVAQQSVPSVYTVFSKEASVVLYDQTKKAPLGSIRVESVNSGTLDAAWEEGGVLQLLVKDGTAYKDGAQLSADLKIMETRNGRDCWKEPLSVKVRIKAYARKEPGVTMSRTVFTLNKQTPKEEAAAAIAVNCQNVRLSEASSWQVYGYNSSTRQYDLQGTATDWLTVGFEEETGMLRLGIAEQKGAVVKTGSYKFRLTNLAEGLPGLGRDITVKVINAVPKVTVKMSGKLDLVNRSSSTLSGKLTLKNIPSKTVSVTILDMDGRGANPYFEASELTGSVFGIHMTEEGKRAPLKTQRTELPIEVKLENGQSVFTAVSFQPVQTVPKITVPEAQTIYKSVISQTRDYDLTGNLAAGTTIKRIDAVGMPEGIGVIAKEGHVLVSLNDRGLKQGTYKIKLNIYFEGEQAVFGYPDGKPLQKTIFVRIKE